MFNHILLPTDGSLFSEKAVEMGLSLAKTLGAQVTMLTASVPFHVLTTDAMSLKRYQGDLFGGYGKEGGHDTQVRS